MVKCHTQTTYELHANDRYNLSDFWSFFFGFRSYGNLKFRYFLAKQITTGPFQFASYLAFDLARSGSHFLRRIRWLPTLKS